MRVLVYVSFFVCFLLASLFFLLDFYPNWAFLLYLIAASCFYFLFIPFERIKKTVNRYQLDLVISGLLIALSLFLYLYRVTEITPGMWGDEISLGWMVEELSHRISFTPYISHNLGHPTPLIYLTSLFIALMGRSMLSLRVVSILFGAFGVGLFYLFLRYFFKRPLALSGAFLLATSYVLVIVSRFAYEMSAGLFFLILSSFLLFILSKKVNYKSVVFFGLSIGAGLYTYLAFRTISLVLLTASLILIWRQKINKFRYFQALVMSVLVVLLPLITYSFRHPGEINQRVQSLSVFSQNLPKEEVIKELQGAAYRSLTLFLFTGDPNPRQNPAGTIPFDYLTVGLFFVGLGLLIVKRRWLGIGTIFICLTILGTEIVTLERIPEFHYYGLGHPNTLRISPLVPIVIFVGVWGLNYLLKKIPDRLTQNIGLSFVLLIIVATNLSRYYNQKQNPWIYTTNFVPTLKIINILNENKPADSIAVSTSIYSSQHVKYFLHPSIELVELDAFSNCKFDEIPEKVIILLSIDISDCGTEQLQALIQNQAYSATTMTSPWNTLDALVIFPKEE